MIPGTNIMTVGANTHSTFQFSVTDIKIRAPKSGDVVVMSVQGPKILCGNLSKTRWYQKFVLSCHGPLITTKCFTNTDESLVTTFAVPSAWHFENPHLLLWWSKSHQMLATTAAAPMGLPPCHCLLHLISYLLQLIINRWEVKLCWLLTYFPEFWKWQKWYEDWNV